MKIYDSITELIGNTPLLRSVQNTGAILLYKLESFNPAGSSKDRVALNILENALATGALSPGGTVIEATSGNTGIGLAAYGSRFGLNVIIVMPDTMSQERIALIRGYGAVVVLTPGALGMTGSIKKAEELAAGIPNSYIASQFDNPWNPEAHYRTTGPEIYRDTDGKVDVFIASVGTGGTLCGTAKYLKEKNPAVEIIGIEPAASPMITEGRSASHKIQGIGANFIPKNYASSVVDRIVTVSDEDAISETAALVKREGILAGISSGCVSFAANRICSDPRYKGKTVVALLPDTGEHYLSTGIFN